jgi:biotin synthase
MLKKREKEALAGKGCSASDALLLARETGESELFQAASRIRERHFGREIQLCSIINAKSGHCDMDCRFCSQSRYSSTEIQAYPFMEKNALRQRIEELLSQNDRHCGVVTSGGRLSRSELKDLTDIGKEIAGPVCASLGRLKKDELEALKDAGITRFHHNLESSASYYSTVCTTQTWQQRLDTVKAAQAAGLEICCGGLFGLGESWEDRIDLALTLRDLGIAHVPINFLYAHPGTPLEKAAPLSAAEALRIVAVYRFLLPTATLRICGGRNHVLGNRQQELFAAGANGLMTGDYLTVAGSRYDTDLSMIHRLGLKIAAP